PDSNLAGNGSRELTEGETVSFDITQGQKGPQAENIIRA
ncbi:cold shock domain-containing protein, partial [Streptomyces antarcticus]